MTIRPIRLLGDPVLRTPAEPVTDFDAELRALVTDLMDTLLGAPGRAGVAAPQIGVSARVFVYDADGAPRARGQPDASRSSEESQDDDEGCLSLPGLYFPTPRARRATVRGVDQHGEPITVTGERLPGPGPAARDRPPGRRALRRHAARRHPPAGAAGDPGAALGQRLTYGTASDRQHLGVRVAQEVVVRDVPAVRAGAAEHQHVADPQPVHRAARGSARRAACTARRPRRPRRRAPRAGRTGTASRRPAAP